MTSAEQNLNDVIPTSHQNATVASRHSSSPRQSTGAESLDEEMGGALVTEGGAPPAERLIALARRDFGFDVADEGELAEYVRAHDPLHSSSSSLALDDLLEAEELDIESWADLADVTVESEAGRGLPMRIRLEADSRAAEETCSAAAVQDKVVGLSVAHPETAKPPLSRGLPWLRSLSVAGSALQTLDLEGFFFLRHLDLSFVTTLAAAQPDLSPVAGTLSRLVLDSCELAAWPATVFFCVKLENLSAQDNELPEPLSPLAGLRALDLRGNPCVPSCAADRAAYEGRLQRLFASLAALDNRNLNTAVGALAASRQQVAGGADAVADGNEDRGSCSCVEGNPCQSEYTCKDWKHRFAVAALHASASASK